MADFILAPNARWQGRDQTGQPCVGGKLYTYLNQTTVPKATYQDYQGLQPNTNPVILDGKGEANIYWAVDDLYTIKLFTADDDEVFTQDNYPFVGSGSSSVSTETDNNIVRNAQFYYWNYGTAFTDARGSQSFSDYVCNDWLYEKESVNSVVNLTRQTFALDQTDVPQNPTYYFNYECTTAGTGETNNRFFQTYKGVNTLAGETVSLSFYAKSSSASTLLLYVGQDFGTGGSPSTNVETLAITADLSSDWQRYTVEALVIPNMVGKTIGSNGNDILFIRFNFPNNSLANIDIANVQFQNSATISEFPFESVDHQFKELDSRVNDGVASTGDVKATLKTTADDGWLMMSDQTIGKVGSNAGNYGMAFFSLYSLIWTNVTNQYAPIFTSAGAISSRGATALDDFNALKQLALTKTLGRIIASAGSAVLANVFTADDTTDVLTLTPGNGGSFTTGTPVTLTTTGTLPAPLALATTYYCIYQSATTVKLATTSANATNGTAIDITNTGTGTHTITINYSSWTLGQAYGEEGHNLVIAEMPSHNHPGSTAPGSNSSPSVTTPYHSFSGSPNSVAVGGDTAITIAAQGGSGRMNIIQPSVFLRYMIKI